MDEQHLAPPTTEEGDARPGEESHPQSIRNKSRWRSRYEGSAAQEFVQKLGAVDFGNAIILFGAAVLLSVLPFIILLSAFANNRVDDDIAQAIGLSGPGARAVEGLFRTPSVSFDLGIAVSLLLGLAGTIALARSVQVVYEQTFDQPRRSGPKTWPRCFVWVLCLAGLLIADAAIARPLGGGIPGRVAIGLVDFVVLTFFFWWSIHFLLAGRVSWNRCGPPALATSLFWMGLGVFSSFYFSSTIVSDSHLYGPIGIIFTLVTWFVAVGAVITLGAIAGVVWEGRRRRSRSKDNQSDRRTNETISADQPGDH